MNGELEFSLVVGENIYLYTYMYRYIPLELHCYNTTRHKHDTTRHDATRDGEVKGWRDGEMGEMKRREKDISGHGSGYASGYCNNDRNTSSEVEVEIVTRNETIRKNTQFNINGRGQR